jgi:hypothetical protein
MEKNTKQLIIGVSFVAVSIGVVFIIDYFQTQSLLKNGIRCNAVITGRFYEVSSKNDTSSYSMRLRAVPDTSTSKGSFINGDVLNAYVDKEIFYKYGEGSIVKVVYDKEDLDHAKLVEEIE